MSTLHLAIYGTLLASATELVLGRPRRACMWLGGALMIAFSYRPSMIISPATSGYVDIAQDSPFLSTPMLVVLAAAATMGFASLGLPGLRFPLPLSAGIFIGGLAIGLAIFWDGTPAQVAGTVALISGWAAWISGRLVAWPLHGRQARALFVSMLVAAMALQAGVVALQAAGVSVFPMDDTTAALMGSRTNGTFVHPAVLAKWIVVLQMLLLVFAAEPKPAIRRAAICGIALGFVPLGLAEGRANIVAAASMLLLWAVVLPREPGSLGRRVALVAGMLLVATPFVGAVAERFHDDPTGGGRPRLAAVAYQQISMRPVTGAGPNSYVTAAAPYDRLAAEGWPVHNSLLLTAGELGIPLSIAFWLPFALLGIRAWRARRADGLTGAASRAYLAALPGWYLTATTGYGLLTAPNLMQFMFAVGLLAGLMSAAPRPKEVATLDKPVGRIRLTSTTW